MTQHLYTRDASSWGHCAWQCSIPCCRRVCSIVCQAAGEADAVHRLAIPLLQVPPVASEGAACCYICELSDTPGRFHPEKAAALGVPKGPMFGRLKSGQAVELPNGKTIQSAEVCKVWVPLAYV